MDFNSIQTEKAKAMARYRLIRNIATVWRLIEVVFAVFLVSWSSARLPSAAKFAAEFAGKISEQIGGYAFSPLVNFTICNTVIVFLFLLSRQAHDGERGGEENIEPALFTEFDFEFHSLAVPLYEAVETPEVLPEEEEMEKQMVLVENAVTLEECEAVGAAIEEAKRQILRFERTQSGNLKRDIWRHRRLRRSKTDVNVRAAVDERAISVNDRVSWSGTDINEKAAVDERAISVIDWVDTLSSEEFKRTIDDYIERRQICLLAQKMEEKQLVEI